MNALLAFYERAKVVATSVLARLSALLAILIFFSDHLNELGPVPEWATQWLTKIIGLLTIVVFQVRKHTPVADDQKGLLPPKGPGTPTIDATGAVHVPDQGDITVHIILAAIAIVCGVLLILFGIGAITFNDLVPWTIAGLGITAAGLGLLV